MLSGCCTCRCLIRSFRSIVTLHNLSGLKVCYKMKFMFGENILTNLNHQYCGHINFTYPPPLLSTLSLRLSLSFTLCYMWNSHLSRYATINENSVSHTASGWNNECEKERRVIKTGAFCQAWIFGNHRKYANKSLPQRIRINGQQIFAHVGGILCMPVFRYPESMFGCICI